MNARAPLCLQLPPQLPKVLIAAEPPAAIRPLIEADRAELGGLMHRAYAGTVDDEGEGLGGAEEEIRRTCSGEYGPFDADASCVWAEGGALRCASLVTGFQGGPFLAYLFTDAAHKGRGLGGHCLRWSIARLHARGATSLRLAVTRANAPALRLYRSMGFEYEVAAVRPRRLGRADAPAYREFRLQALQASPEAFGSSHEEEAGRPLEAFADLLHGAGDDRVYFGVWQGDDLVGAVGVGREAGLKERHIGHLRSLYVAPAARRQGIARSLVERALKHAQQQAGLVQIVLSVTSTQEAAIALYESLGFRTCGRMPRALQVGGAYFDELMMVRPLDG